MTERGESFCLRGNRLLEFKAGRMCSRCSRSKRQQPESGEDLFGLTSDQAGWVKAGAGTFHRLPRLRSEEEVEEEEESERKIQRDARAAGRKDEGWSTGARSAAKVAVALLANDGRPEVGKLRARGRLPLRNHGKTDAECSCDQLTEARSSSAGRWSRPPAPGGGGLPTHRKQPAG